MPARGHTLACALPHPTCMALYIFVFFGTSTPGSIASRALVSLWASTPQGKPRIKSLAVSRAFFYDRAKCEVYIKLPAEDPNSQNGNAVGVLTRAMHGTRDAPAIWSAEINRLFTEIGFRSLRSDPCVYVHDEGRQLMGSNLAIC